MKLLKTTISKTKYFFLALLVAFSFSCSPEDGENGMDGQDGAIGLTGPAGLNGTDGTNGTNGTDGTDGTDGEDGNANVISSGWTEFDITVWEPMSSQFSVDYRNYPITVPEITQDIVDDGMVLVYSRFIITGTQAYMLPYTENITGTDPAGQMITFRIELNDLTIKMRNVSGTGDPGTFGAPGVAEYRYLIIPSNSFTKMKDTDLSKMSYEEVIDFLGLDY